MTLYQLQLIIWVERYLVNMWSKWSSSVSRAFTGIYLKFFRKNHEHFFVMVFDNPAYIWNMEMERWESNVKQ